MKPFAVSLLALLTVSLSASAQFTLPKIGNVKLPTLGKTGTTAAPGGVSNADAANGLKEALIQGISKGADQASQANGFNLNSLIRIPFPPDAQKVATRLRALGFSSQVDAFELSLNRGAEDAAKSAKPIFLNAIKILTFTDVWDILSGQKDAATQYLKRTTTGQLTTAFQPIIQQSLDKVGATGYYTSLSSTYNATTGAARANRPQPVRHWQGHRRPVHAHCPGGGQHPPEPRGPHH